MNYPASSDAALERYKGVETYACVEQTSPHRLIQVLMEGALEKIDLAKGHMQRGETALKGSHISWAISIIEGLHLSLDQKGGGQIAQNLGDLYDYMNHRLIEANKNNSADILDEVAGLLHEVKSAWDAVPELLQAQYVQQEPVL